MRTSYVLNGAYKTGMGDSVRNGTMNDGTVPSTCANRTTRVFAAGTGRRKHVGALSVAMFACVEQCFESCVLRLRCTLRIA